MKTLEQLKKDLLADGVIDAAEVKELKEKLANISDDTIVVEHLNGIEYRVIEYVSFVPVQQHERLEWLYILSPPTTLDKTTGLNAIYLM
jgi:hypothetical protein